MEVLNDCFQDPGRYRRCRKARIALRLNVPMTAGRDSTCIERGAGDSPRNWRRRARVIVMSHSAAQRGKRAAEFSLRPLVQLDF